MDALPLGRGVGTARTLSHLGLIPFIAGTGLAWASDGPVRDTALIAVAAYGATILSFIGAIHWGRVIAAADGDQDALWLAWGVVPSLLGWIAVLLPAALTMPALLAVFALAWAGDRLATRRGRLPAWYGALRNRLTMVVCTTLASAIPLTL